jgi:xylulokinase
MIVCGIDVGTQGARCVLVGEAGEALGEAESPFECPARAGLPEGWFEQEPADWLGAVRKAVHAALRGLSARGLSASEIVAASVTGTSGTLCPVDAAGAPVGPAIMYNDSRSAAEAEAVQQAGAAVAAALGYKFGSSFGLPKILWLKAHEADRFDRARWMLSPTDVVIGWMTGRCDCTDQTNALKFGYDLLADRWPDYIERDLGVPLRLMPRVQPTGTLVGGLTAERAADLGLPAGTPVAAGLTDGCASQVSSGAVAPGDFNTTIGTTLVVKGVSRRLLVDPQGRLYCHRHPEGWWLPGGASNTGAECLTRRFEANSIKALDAEAEVLTPTDLVAYPLVGRGERFPFRAPQAEGFLLGTPSGEGQLFTACLEGVACLERLALEMIERELGGEVGPRIYSAGGGSRSDVWLRIRADTLGRTVLRPAAAGGAMGAAIVAASLARHEPLTAAARRMVRIERQVPPTPSRRAAYDEKYGRFLDECRRRGYVR